MCQGQGPGTPVSFEDLREHGGVVLRIGSAIRLLVLGIPGSSHITSLRLAVCDVHSDETNLKTLSIV